MNVFSGLSFLPVAPLPLLLVVAALGMALIWWPAGPRERSEPAVARGRRTAMVVLLLVAALRPAIPGNDVRVDASAVDVYLVVDTTSSVMARDYADARPRLEGVRADIKALTTQLAGARFALLTFDIDTTVRLPLTSDGAAVSAAADTLRPETSVWSRGSSVTIARDQLRTALERGRDTHPERARLVFYFGDGEQTRRRTLARSTSPASSSTGARSSGYGTAAGGRMAITAAFETGDIVDPSTGQPAISVIDEEQLAAISNQLGVPYLHRTANDGGLAIVEGVRLKELAPLRATDSGEIVGGRAELGWVALCCWRSRRLGDQGLVAAASKSRRPVRPRPAASSSVSPRAGMRLAALRPNRTRRRPAEGTTIARPLGHPRARSARPA